MASKKKPLRLRVMAEYGSSGIWQVIEKGSFRHAMRDHSSLNLPPALSEAFSRWIARYEERLLAPGEFDAGAFNAEGRRLARELRAHLGPAGSVEFVPEMADGSLGDPEEM